MHPLLQTRAISRPDAALNRQQRFRSIKQTMSTLTRLSRRMHSPALLFLSLSLYPTPACTLLPLPVSIWKLSQRPSAARFVYIYTVTRAVEFEMSVASSLMKLIPATFFPTPDAIQDNYRKVEKSDIYRGGHGEKPGYTRDFVRQQKKSSVIRR